jgi:hypothetical protein
VSVVFYRPEADMLESEPYVRDLPFYARGARQVSNLFNIYNASRRAIMTYRETRPAFLDLSTSCDLPPFLSEGEGEEDGGEDEGEGEGTSRTGTAPEGTEGEREGAVRPCYSHVEIVVGNVTYGVRWGESVSRQLNKRYAAKHSVYSSVSLALSPEARERLSSFCEGYVESGVRFNHYGVYANFLLPLACTDAVFGDGAGYSDPDAVYCSEFVARALCRAGVFRDRSERKGTAGAEGTPSPPPIAAPAAVVLGDTAAKYVDARYDVWVDPCRTDPNSLYVLLMAKGFLVRVLDLPGPPFSGRSAALCVYESVIHHRTGP